MDNKEVPQPVEAQPKPDKYERRGLLRLFKPFIRILKPLSQEERTKLSATAEGRGELRRKDYNRRTFLKGLGALGITTALAGAGLKIYGGQQENQEENKSIESKPETDILDINLANKILNTAPGPERYKDENLYTNKTIESGKLKDIDTAFWFVSNTEDRVRLLEKRGEIRNEGKSNLKPLSKEEKDFCKANNFHEEWVAICIDSHLKTKEILQNKIAEMKGMENFIKLFRPDLADLIKTGKIDPKGISLDDLVLPVGALIGIAWSEIKTIRKDGKIHALADIGKVPSINYITVEEIKDKQLMTKNLEAVKQKERDLCKMLSVNGIEYDPNKVPGSDKTGDIGSVQFRPDTAYDFINFCKDKGIDFSFNPFGLEAVTGACLMLSIGQRIPVEKGEENVRIAYINGKEEGSPLYKHMIKSFQRWNGSLVDNILNWRKEYGKYVKN